MVEALILSMSAICGEEKIGCEAQLPPITTAQLDEFTRIGIDVAFNFPFSHMIEKEKEEVWGGDVNYQININANEELFQTWVELAIPLPKKMGREHIKVELEQK